MIPVIEFRGCGQSISSGFGGFHLLLVVAWSVSRVLCCWWSQAIGPDSSKVGVDECLDPLQCRSCGSLCFAGGFYSAGKDPDFDVDGQVG